MKNKIILLCVALSLVVGCSTVDRKLTRPAPQPVTELHTNSLTGEIKSVTYVPLELSPSVTPYIQTGQTVAEVLPSPWREAAAGVVAGLGALATLYVRTRNRQIKELAAEANEKDNALRTVAAVIETNAPDLKPKVSAQAKITGAESVLKKVVSSG